MYTAQVLESKEITPGCWNVLRVGVFDENGNQVGEYERNYHNLYETFFPFKKGDKWYALYSRDYTSTRVMSLPDCKDLGGEERDTWGFCPVEYYVPYEEHEGEFDTFEAHPEMGLVAGCVWGDDCSWKIQYLDLSKVEEGIIKRDNRFGYIELPSDMKLKDAVTGVWQCCSGLCVKMRIEPTYIIGPDGKVLTD